MPVLLFFFLLRFFNEMGGSSSKATVNYLISLIDRVHKIYEETVWRDSAGGQGFSGMGFIIKKIVVHRKPTDVREGEGGSWHGRRKHASHSSKD